MRARGMGDAWEGRRSRGGPEGGSRGEACRHNGEGKGLSTGGWRVLVLAWLGLLGVDPGVWGAERAERARVLEVRGTVEFQQAGSSTWYLVATNQMLFEGDALRTGPRSGATLMLTNRAIAPVSPLTTLRFQERRERLAVEVLRGLLYLFHRGDPDDLEVQGGGVNAAVRGTEFAFAVGEDGSVQTTLYDGRIRVSDAAGGVLDMASGDVVVAALGRRVERAGTILVGDWTAVQWALEYPVILDGGELGWDGGAPAGLEASWEGFVRGDLVAALAAYPAGRAPETDAERVFLAALLLSVGEIGEAEALLAEVAAGGGMGGIAEAHRRLIEWVRRGVAGGEWDAGTATAGLAASYVFQGARRLEDARDAAKSAVQRSPGFGWGWVRWAELEFSLGNRREAEKALERGLALLPGNGRGKAVLGFVQAAANRMAEAERSFQEALQSDGRLGSAWLGRGLSRIRRGDLAGGREDLLVAAALEPQRAAYRAYLGKAFAEVAGFRVSALAAKAREELDLARRLDPGDPTAWLYGALLNQQENRVNEAIDALRESLLRNDNRAVYRSTLGLDQDRAVRSANLANLFADVGFQDLGVREATRAVNQDYANASAHLFLANSYDALRDPRQIRLRYETPWYSEYLLANLLAPVGAGSLSQTVAQNEYSRLFERDRLGVANRTTWTSNGDWLAQVAQVGQFGNLAYALEGAYRSEQGQRLNNDLEQRSVSITSKIQAGPDDGVLVQATVGETDSGDVLQRYDPAMAVGGLRLRERQEPLAHVGWNHAWGPGRNTLLLVSPWNARQSLVNPSNAVPWVLVNPAGDLEWAQYSPVPLENYETRLTGVSAELQQLWQTDRHVVVGGVRYQHGGFDTTARLNVDEFAPDAPTESASDPGMERLSAYAYDQWNVVRGVFLTLGLSYDRLTQPRNFRTAPLTEGVETLDRVLPKIGITVTPWDGGTLRAAWARSLGGVSMDQSFRLEPVQVAGFTQVYRGLMPESVVGSVSGQDVSVVSAAWDQVFSTRTWVTLTAERLASEASPEVGGFVYRQDGFESTTAFRQEFEYREDALGVTVGQLVGRDLSFVVRYRVSEATLDGWFPGMPAGVGLGREERSVFQHLTLGMRYQRPEGFFGSWETAWMRQDNHDDAAWMAGDRFWRHDLWVGWRFLRRRAELALGLLNVTDEDFRLYPLNDFAEMYRERTVAVTGRFAF